MYIDPESTIAGIPIVAVRDFLRQVEGLDWNTKYLSQRLDLSQVNAKHLVAELLRLGYIEVDQNPGSGEWYKRTLAGSTFSLASAARPLKRETARRKIEEFLERVRAVNESDYFLYRVKKVLVFGSYLRDRDKINDIDVAVELVHREPDPERRQDADRQRIEEALQAGRRFQNIVDEIFWPYREVLLFLKARSRAISLRTTDDGILKSAESQLVFEMSTGSTSAQTN